MNESIFVNIVRSINAIGLEAGISATIPTPKKLVIRGPGQEHEVRLIVLTRPTVAEIKNTQDGNSLLVLNRPNGAARQAAHSANHITLPDAGVRIILPGMVLISPGKPKESLKRASIKLKGASGRIIETLLLHPKAYWNLRDLAAMANVSLGLTHRIVSFIAQEGLIEERDLTGNSSYEGHGFGGGTGSGAGFGDGSGYGGGWGYEEIPGASQGRVVINPTGLLKLWAESSHSEGRVFARGYMYAPNPVDAVKRIELAIPGACAGSGLAANTYVAQLTNVPAPYKVWIPEAYASTEFLGTIEGLDIVNEGANLQFCSVKGDHWSLHATEWAGMRRISRPRSYVELYESKGRMQDLAEAILESMR